MTRTAHQPAPLSSQEHAIFAEIRMEAENRIKANDLLVASTRKQTSLSLEDFITEVAREHMKREGF